jgi:Domain of unknown function (DUF4382)
MRNIKEKLIWLSVVLGFLTTSIFISSCSNSTTSPATSQGQMKVTMVDSPAGYDQINIVVTRVEVHKSGTDSTSGWVVINNISATYNLLTLRNGASVVLGNSALDVGHYTQIRLILGAGSNIVVNGVAYSLDIASGAQTGIKLNQEFDIQANVVYELMLDFNAEHSIVLTGNGQYKLKPVIRVVPVVISGTISGIITPLNNEALVYVVSGTDTISTIEELITGEFKLMAVIQGTYNVRIFSGNLAYNDTTIANVIVVATHNTDLGTINLSHK